jgi:acetolactate synthase-1/2/3 large subunit
VWVAQSFEVKQGQRVIFSGGHGAMGYSLPAAIGAYYASKNPVICMNGDGGLQMNIQELQFIARENLPITVIVFNNNALGMIRHFQEMYFESNYAQTVKSGGYEAPSFEKIAKAYELKYYRIMNENDITEAIFNEHGPLFVEIVLEESTYVFPKLEFGKPNQDQEPLIERELYKKLMEL